MIQLALIGAGAWGKNYISTLKTSKDAQIKYVCSRTKKTLELLRGNYIKTSNYKDLFKCSDIDGVIISTPNSTHFEISKEFLKEGFNLLIEKPFVENYKQSEELKLIQKKSGSKVMIGHNYLFDPAYIKTKKLLKSVKPIRYISYEGTNNGPYRKGTSVLWDIGPHAISLCLDIFQKAPSHVSAWALDSLKQTKGFYDFSFIKLKFPNNCDAYIKISWLFPIKKRELVVVGEKNAVIYDAISDKKVVYFRNMIHSEDESAEIKYPKYDTSKSLENEIKEFVDVVKNDRKTYSSDLDFGVEVTKIISLAEQSIQQNGKPVTVK